MLSRETGEKLSGAAAQGLSGHQLGGGRLNFFVQVTAKALLRIKGNIVTILPKNLYQVYSIKGKKKKSLTTLMNPLSQENHYSTVCLRHLHKLVEI